MSQCIKIIKSLKNTDNKEFTVTFSNGETLNFTDEEAFEYGLYQDDKNIENFNKLCTMILAKRMMTFAASYVLFSMKSIYQVKIKLEEYNKKNPLEDGWMAFYDDAVNEALKRLEELNYINDEIYAYRYVNTALKGKPVSKAYLLNELVYKKGVDKYIAEKVVEDIYNENDKNYDIENACKVIKKKMGTSIPYVNDAQSKKEMDKIYRFAMSKGFSYNTIQEALQLLRENN